MQPAVQKFESVIIREIEPSDLGIFYGHQLDPEAVRIAGFVGRNRTDRAVFDAHWQKITRDPLNTNRTIVADGQVAGYIGCFPSEENLEVAFWLGREFWGRGVATRALQQLLLLVNVRPILAHVVATNLGSLKALQKCGFKITGKNQDCANGPGEGTEEYELRLD